MTNSLLPGPHSQCVVTYYPRRTNHILHLLLTIFTFGFWAVIWIILAIANSSAGPRQVVAHVDARPLAGCCPPRHYRPLTRVQTDTDLPMTSWPRRNDHQHRVSDRLGAGHLDNGHRAKRCPHHRGGVCCALNRGNARRTRGVR